MFSLDPRIRGVPARREQVLAFYSSINQPHVAIPGKRAGTAQGYVVGMRSQAGLNALVYLYLAESNDCAVFTSDTRNVGPDQYDALESDALAFMESMGFMMDNMNFVHIEQSEQEEMMRTLPVFMKDPSAARLPGSAATSASAGVAATSAPSSASVASSSGSLNIASATSTASSTRTAASTEAVAAVLGKIFSAFCLCLVVTLAHGCKTTSSQKDQQAAQIRYDLGVNAQQNNDIRMALSEFQEALKLDPNFPEAHNALAIVLHLAFHRPEEAITHYEAALKLQPNFSEAKVNLANVYLDLKRYDEAIVLYEQVLNDMLYRTPYIAQSNLGWALFKKGQVTQGIGQIKAAVTTNPKFCLGYKNLGLIYDEQKNLTEACRQFGNYRENCPEVADAYFREGVCLAKVGKVDAARDRFSKCEAKASTPTQKDDCRLYEERLR